MPFQSEKQRRYLWANEPEIARDWSKKYGSRVRKVNGGMMDKIMPYVYPEAHGEKYSTRGQWAKNTPQYHRDITENYFDELSQNWSQLPYVGKPAAAAIELFAPAATGVMSLPYDTYSAFKKFYDNPQKYEDAGKWSKVNDIFPGLADTNVAGILSALDREDMFSAAGNRFVGAARPLAKRMQKGWDAIKNEFSGSAQAGEPEKIIGKNPITDIYDRDYTAGEHYTMTPDDKTKDMQYDWEGNFRGSNHPEYWGKREFNPVKYNQMKDMLDRYNYPRVAEDTSDLSGMAEVRTPTAEKFANLDKFTGIHDSSVYDKWGNRQMAEEKMDPARPQKKGFLDTVRGGITNVLDNTIIGKIAAMNNPFNPRAANYQPGFRESVDAYQRQGMLGDVGRGPYTITQGPMAGYNMVSMFGSNNYRNMIGKRLSKITARKHAGKTYSKNIEKKLRDEMRAETERQNNQIAPGTGMSYNQVVDAMVQDRSPERRGKPGGIGGKELMAQGGIAGLWPR
mgnify:CR=1 FL=1